MDVELREALSNGFGPEPEHRPLVDRLEAGHRAVRRRRLAGAVVTVAVAVAAVVGVGAVAILGDGGRAPSQVATDPAVGWTDGELARYDNHGELEVLPGVTVLERIDAPLPAIEGEHRSVALSLEHDGKETWWLLEWDEGGWSSASWHPGGAFSTLHEWIAEQVALRANPEDFGNAEYLTFADDGSLVTTHGVTILEQRHPIELANFVEKPTDRTAAALLKGPDGKKWYVLVRDLYGEIDTQVTTFKAGGPNLDAFIRFATDAFASGEGLR